MQKVVNISLYHDTRRSKKSGKYPLKLLVTHNRETKLYYLGKDLTSEQYAKAISEKPRQQEHRDLKIQINHFVEKADKITNNLQPNFTFDRFKKLYFEEISEKIESYFDNYIKKLKSQGRINYKDSFESTKAWLTKFKPELTIGKVTVEFLEKLESYLLQKNKSRSTIGVYMRNIRVIINQARIDGLINDQTYPFGRSKYVIPHSRNVKKALTIKEIKKIFDYKCISGNPTWEEKAKDFWLFMYLCNGINVKDLCRLRYKDYDGKYLTFVRAKTERSLRDSQEQYQIYVNEFAKRIIHKYGQRPRDQEKYIFPFLTEDISPEKEAATVRQVTRNINKWIKSIAQELGIKKVVTTYFARHSFATILRNSGAPIEYISEALRHRDVKTTKYYLDSFESEVKKKWSKKLTDFS